MSLFIYDINEMLQPWLTLSEDVVMKLISARDPLFLLTPDVKFTHEYD
jgi:hypothetical protein